MERASHELTVDRAAAGNPGGALRASQAWDAEALLAPRSVAVFGASRTPGAVGHVIVRNLRDAGFTGPIYPVNPAADEIAGLPAYHDADDLPSAPDLAVICTPARSAPGIVSAVGARGARAAIVISAGFAEFGTEGRALQGELLAAARAHGVRLVGPNCVGVIAPFGRLDASFAHRRAAPGGIALLSQSGAILTTVLDWASARGIGFSVLASLGAMADLGFGDFLVHLADDPHTDAIVLYVEGVADGAAFLAGARAAALKKPVIVIKPGRHAAAAEAAFSHTGALAGADAVYDAAFRRAGLVRVDTLADVFTALEALAHPWAHRGDRLGIVTNGGGVGVLAVDALAAAGGALAALAPQTIAELDPRMPPAWSRRNPVDILGDAPGARYAAALAALDADPGVDAILALNCPTAVADSLEAAETTLAHRPSKPLLAAWLGEAAAAPARRLFEAAGVPNAETPTAAVVAFMTIVQHRRNQALLRVEPARPAVDPARQGAANAMLAAAAATGRDTLDEVAAKDLLALYGVPIVATRRVADPEAAADAAQTLGFPSAIKIVSPDLPHKTDVGGVVLDLPDADAVRAAASAMLTRIAARAPNARLEGISVQRMAKRPSAHELILGLHHDPAFGPVVLFGHGGTAVEVIDDTAIGLPPLDGALARELIGRTRVARLLAGYRDRPPVDLDAIARALIGLSDLALELPAIRELDINPLWADAAGVVALDARVRFRA